MAYQLTPLMLLYASIFVLTVSLALYAVVRYVRDDRRLPILAFAMLMISISFWEIGNFVLEMVTSPELKLITNNIINGIVIPIYLFSLLFFSLAFSDNRQWIKWVAVVSAILLAGLSTLLVLDPEFLYEARGLVTRGPFTILGFTFEEFVLLNRELNPSFRLFALYSYFVTVASAGILIRYVSAKAGELETQQSLLIGVGIGTPLTLNGMVYFGVLPPDLNITDIGFGVTAVCFAVAIFEYQLFELTPISRQQLFSTIDDPLVFVNDENRVVYSNPPARQVFDVGSNWRGTNASDFLAPHAERILPSRADESKRNSTIELDDGDRYFDVNATTIQAPSGETAGRTIALREITELKETNQRLDEFASMVSHDLRTPLNNAVVQTNRLAQDQSDERVETLQEALDRMESMIDDMLGIARAGADIETTEECSLGELAEEVWGTIETDGAKLDCHVEDTTIEADPIRLFQVLENLFRNALDHNDSPPTVRVGTLNERGEFAVDDEPVAFFIEDDGCGIPEDQRNDILEHGYSTNQDGSGYGLSVVRHIVDAHDWEIHVTDGTDGGTRFEISGIEAR